MSNELIKYKITFAESQIRTSEENLTFTIGKIKSRTPSVVYFKFYGYDLRNNLITEHTSKRWVITSHYTNKSETFNAITDTTKKIEDLDHIKIEIYLLGITSENPLYLNHIQLNTGLEKPYHIPNEAIQHINLGFHKNSYLNLYDTTDNFLQIIRPSHESFSTDKLTPSQCTILAPHLAKESEFDNPVALLYEYMYQTEQIIGVEK